MHQKIPLLLRWVMAIVWTILLVILLVQPEDTPLIDTGIPPGPVTFEREFVFTSAHTIAYSVLTALWVGVAVNYVTLKRALQIVIVFALILGLITELAQAFSPDRYPSITDYIANVMGITLTAHYIWRQQTRLSVLIW